METTGKCVADFCVNVGLVFMGEHWRLHCFSTKGEDKC